MRPRNDINPDEIIAALNACEGDVAAAARRLEVSERTLYRRMTEYGIRAQRRYDREAAETAV